MAERAYVRLCLLAGPTAAAAAAAVNESFGNVSVF
jgi:hypothetical protein